MWCIPPEQDARFVAAMEDVLEVYARPYDELRPVVCLDEGAKQLLAQVRGVLPLKPHQPQRFDNEYERL
jgi:nucleotidyltransferase/DNA polymerase involved in DNA repair